MRRRYDFMKNSVSSSHPMLSGCSLRKSARHT
nr:MAG TPA: hypothetical protein [Caudoviricetes sp.]